MGQVLERGDASVPAGPSRIDTGVASGLGGVGKPQVALDYAEQQWAADAAAVHRQWAGGDHAAL
ncbi:hypothetical protein CFP71_27815 [Amycolatopsis thailandensis]|uniref:Uncharacterized protein n=1 Tax=Amycolatopsis thailandensis TaxID=589330 RepID=A0A229RV74_9PSEU|nr:hypothetical protein CFP71_27815 [Amycolatopsis thailandensis]